jgi:hypothetical protein
MGTLSPPISYRFLAICCAAPGIVLDGVGAGGEDVGVDGDVLGFGDLHVVQGLGVAPRLDRTAVAELLTVPLFLADDHDRLVVDLLATLAGDVGPGDEHARIDAVIVLTADLGVVVVDVFKDVFQADALRMSHDAHLVHGRQLAFELLLQKTEQLLQGFQLPDGFLLGQARLAGDVFAELGLQHDDVGIFIGAKNIKNVLQAVPQFLYAFFIGYPSKAAICFVTAENQKPSRCLGWIFPGLNIGYCRSNRRRLSA